MKEMFLTSAIDMDAALFSGQAFRWEPRDFGFIGSVEENAAAIYKLGDGYRLIWQGGADEEYWLHYFDLERDYGAIAKRYEHDSRIKSAFDLCEGLRVLNQPVWEALIGFIISANNNDKRIRLIMRRLCESLGEKKLIGENVVHLFPSVEALSGAGSEKLRQLGCGYRAEYIAETSARVAEGYDLESLKSMGYEAALKELITFKGVGEKVADCILLFSCGYSCAFPVDVWVERVMQNLYGMEGNRRQIKAKSARLFGGDAGIVQQMLFHSARKGQLDL